MTAPEPEYGSRAWFEREVAGRHPSVVHVVRYFAWMHLPEPIASISMIFGSAAIRVTSSLPDGPELVVALRKLLEAKDAACRAMVDQMSAPTNPEGTQQ